MTEVQGLVVVVQYYRDMWPRWYHISSPLEELTSGPKGRKIPCNVTLEYQFTGINRMVYADTLLDYSSWKITFNIHAYFSDKHFCYFMSYNNKNFFFQKTNEDKM